MNKLIEKYRKLLADRKERLRLKMLADYSQGPAFTQIAAALEEFDELFPTPSGSLFACDEPGCARPGIVASSGRIKCVKHGKTLSVRFNG